MGSFRIPQGEVVAMEDIPKWLHVLIYGAVALGGAFVGSITLAVRISAKFDALDKKFDALASDLKTTKLEMVQYVDKELSRRYHDLVDIIHKESQEIENRQEKINERTGRLEQDMAVMKERQILQTTLAGILTEIRESRKDV